jgi:hypothetical protein
MHKHQGVSLDSRAIGSLNPDEMNFPYVGSKQTIVQTFQFTGTDPTGTVVSRFGVTPAINIYMSEEKSSLLSPCGLISSLFRFWHGEMHYRITVVAPSMYGCSLAISYCPQGFGSTSPTTEKHQQLVVDLRDRKEILFTVKWSSQMGVLITNESVLTMPWGEFDPNRMNGEIMVTLNSPLMGMNSQETPIAMGIIEAWADPSMHWFLPGSIAALSSKEILDSEVDGDIIIEDMELPDFSLPSPSGTSAPQATPTQQPVVPTMAPIGVLPTPTAFPRSLAPSVGDAGSQEPTYITEVGTQYPRTMGPDGTVVPTLASGLSYSPAEVVSSVSPSVAQVLESAEPSNLVVSTSAPTEMTECTDLVTREFGGWVFDFGGDDVELRYNASGEMEYVIPAGTTGVVHFVTQQQGPTGVINPREVRVIGQNMSFANMAWSPIDGTLSGSTDDYARFSFTRVGGLKFILESVAFSNVEEAVFSGLRFPTSGGYHIYELTAEELSTWPATYPLSTVTSATDGTGPEFEVADFRPRSNTPVANNICGENGDSFVVVVFEGTLQIHSQFRTHTRIQSMARSTSGVDANQVQIGATNSSPPALVHKIFSCVNIGEDYYPPNWSPTLFRRRELKSEGAETVHSFGFGGTSVPNVSKIHSGEQICSLRSFLKVFNLSGHYELAHGQRISLGLYTTIKPTEPVAWNLILSCYLAVRGAICANYIVESGEGTLRARRGRPQVTTNELATQALASEVTHTDVNRSLTVEFPYQNFRRFCYTRNTLRNREIGAHQERIVEFTNYSGGSALVREAILAAEDFSLGYFIGPPLLLGPNEPTHPV